MFTEAPWFLKHSVVMACWIKSLTSNMVARVRFPTCSEILISILGLSVCVLSVFCPVLSLAAARTPPADDRFREACPFVSVLYSVLFHSLCSPYRHLAIVIWVVCPGGGVNLTLLGTASLKSQEWLKWCCQGALWLAKRLSLNLNFSFLNRIRYFSYQVATQLSSWGWVHPIPYPIRPEKFVGYSRESNPGPLGWQSDMLTTVPNRRSNLTLRKGKYQTKKELLKYILCNVNS